MDAKLDKGSLHSFQGNRCTSAGRRTLPNGTTSLREARHKACSFPASTEQAICKVLPRLKDYPNDPEERIEQMTEMKPRQTTEGRRRVRTAMEKKDTYSLVASGFLRREEASPGVSDSICPFAMRVEICAGWVALEAPAGRDEEGVGDDVGLRSGPSLSAC